jgi:hypothetical protein
MNKISTFLSLVLGVVAPACTATGGNAAAEALEGDGTGGANATDTDDDDGQTNGNNPTDSGASVGEDAESDVDSGATASEEANARSDAAVVEPPINRPSGGVGAEADASTPTSEGNSASDGGTACREPVIDAPPRAATPIIKCGSAVALGDAPVIDDFEDSDLLSTAVDGRDGIWWQNTNPPPSDMGPEVVEDPVRSGLVLSYRGGPYAVFSVFGVTLHLTETDCEFCSYDASVYDGIRFAARGDVNVWVGLEMPSVRSVAEGGTCPDDAFGCWDQHGTSIQLTGDWQEYVLPFAEARQRGWGYEVPFDPSELYAVVFHIPVAAAYEVFLDDIEFYKD